MKIRKHMCIWLFEKSKIPYSKLFKTNKLAWNLTNRQLLNFPSTTLGYRLGHFLATNNFSLIPKLERHDAYHVITGYGTKIEEEISLQYFLFGNGKRSFYLFGVAILGFLILPEYSKLYLQSYKHGKSCSPISQFNIKESLSLSLNQIQSKLHLK